MDDTAIAEESIAACNTACTACRLRGSDAIRIPQNIAAAWVYGANCGAALFVVAAKAIAAVASAWSAALRVRHLRTKGRARHSYKQCDPEAEASSWPYARTGLLGEHQDSIFLVPKRLSGRKPRWCAPPSTVARCNPGTSSIDGIGQLNTRIDNSRPIPRHRTSDRWLKRLRSSRRHHNPSCSLQLDRRKPPLAEEPRRPKGSTRTRRPRPSEANALRGSGSSFEKTVGLMSVKRFSPQSSASIQVCSGTGPLRHGSSRD
jgi:hypothetical protein